MLGGPQVRFMSAPGAPAPPPTRYVQGITYHPVTNPTPYKTSVLAGSLLVALFTTYDTTGVTTPMTVHDNLNGAWTQGPKHLQTGAYMTVVWYYVNAVGGTTQLTWTDPGGNTDIASLVEYRGFGAFDTSAVNGGVGTAMSAGPTPALAVAGELVIACAWSGNTTGGAEAPYTARLQGAHVVADNVVTTPAGQSMTAHQTPATRWNAIVATFKPV